MGRTEGSKKMTLTVKRLIAEAAVTNYQKPRRALATELQSRIKSLGEIVPSEETIEKLISRFRNIDPHPQDNLWSVASVEKYPNLFPPEALPSLLRAWVYVREHNNGSFTIRQAKWVAILYAVIKDIPRLVDEALGYAQMELMADIIPGGEIDTQGSDLALFEVMTGEKISLERRCQILGIDKNEEWIAKLVAEEKSHSETEPHESPIPHALKMGNCGDRNFYEKYLKTYRLIRREVKSEEEWLARIPELKKLFNELGLEVPEEYKEEQT